jgi:hypothetical protein
VSGRSAYLISRINIYSITQIQPRQVQDVTEEKEEKKKKKKINFTTYFGTSQVPRDHNSHMPNFIFTSLLVAF